MKKLLALLILSLVPGILSAQTRPKEDDLFGGEQTKPTASRSVDEAGAPAMPKKDITEENLQIGGTLSSEADYYLVNGVPLEQDNVANPNLLFLYLDSKLENDARVFARARLYYDPTGLTGGGGTASFSNPYGFGLGTDENLKVSLQELRISANLDRKIFFTIGRQKVKYGAAKFFNPTDFLNSQQFDFFLPSDERPGVDMVKMHIPSGTANLYVAGMTGNPTNGNPSGGYFRGEVGYDPGGGLLGSGEISLSGILPRGGAGKAGFDLSQAIGDFDVYFEGAMGQNAAGDWKDATSVGASWEVKYGDRSTDTLTLEAEHFQAGALAEYGILALYLPSPAGWTDMTFVETNLYNLIDQSGLSRLDLVCQFSSRISGRIYGTGHWGSLSGTFYLPGQMAELGTRLDVNF
jgi:hypothetical protein